jgi:hypothetical protein
MFVVCLLAPIASQAALQWSGCLTITGFTNALAYNNSFTPQFSGPVFSGCTQGSGVSAVNFQLNQAGVTDANFSSIIATILTAYSAGHQVMVYYDNSASPNCYGQIVAINGYGMQCP